MPTLSEERFMEGIRAVEALREAAIALKLAQLQRAHHNASAAEMERLLQGWLAEDNVATGSLRIVARPDRG